MQALYYIPLYPPPLLPEVYPRFYLSKFFCFYYLYNSAIILSNESYFSKSIDLSSFSILFL